MNYLNFIGTIKKKYCHLYEELQEYIILDALNVLSKRHCKAIHILNIVSSTFALHIIIGQLRILVEVNVFKVCNILYVYS